MPRLELPAPAAAPSAADRVASELRSSILACRIKPGEEFSLRQIAGTLGVSIIPVREALRSLEAEGLLLTRRGRSASVLPLTHDELDGAFNLRRQIEPELAAAAAPLHTPESLDRAEELLDGCRPGLTPDEHADSHLRFHCELLRPAATAMDERVIESLGRATSRYARLVLEPFGSPREQHRGESWPDRNLLAAFRTGDPDQSYRAMQRRLDCLEELCRRAVPAERTVPGEN
jgi:DNA-binding GntR family transcriptional regulator